ncbi:MAG TPA: c-type cytochrome [Janthinobacterium sp.]|jgi:cytochrome c553|nr:c-type cytochrome [Janthinobacterium sp.]
MMTTRPDLFRRAGAAAAAAVLALLASVAVQPAFANAAAGETKAQTCFACHGPAGNSATPAFPSLAGQPRQFIMLELFQFREGKRKNELMSPLAAPLSNADLTDLADYFSTQSITPGSVKTPPAIADAGKALAVKNNCINCHAANLMGQQQMPRLAGQQKDYLRTQLLGFKASTRADTDGDMTSVAQGLSAQDIDVLAEYLSGLPTTR